MKRRIALLSALMAVGLSVAAVVVPSAPQAASADTGSSCGMATPGTGTYSTSLCFLDMSGYNASQATSAAGQQLSSSLPGGYTASFTLNVSGGQGVSPNTFPTYAGAFLGNGVYTNVPGKPALYAPLGTGTVQTNVKLSALTITDKAGTPVTGFSLVSADAEATDGLSSNPTPESITWTASSAFTSLQPLGNACAGGFTGVGTTTVACVGGGTGATKTGAPIVAANNPTSLQASMTSYNGRQAVAFGFLFESISLTKNVVNGTPGDTFDVSVLDGSGNSEATASTNGGTTATTGTVYLIGSTAGSSFTMRETPAPGNTGSYVQNWACSSTASSSGVMPSLPSGPNVGPSATMTLLPGQAVSCTISNTAQAAPVTLTKKWVNAIPGSTAKLAIAGTAVAGATTATSTAGVGPNPDTANVASATANLGSTVTLSETSGGTAAPYVSTFICTQAGTSWTAVGASFAMPSTAGAVSCVVTNTAVDQSVKVEKSWVIQDRSGTVIGTYSIPSKGSDTGAAVPSGFSAALTLTGQTNPSFGTVHSGYVAGQNVTVGEGTVTVPSGCTVSSQNITAVNGAALPTPAALPYTTTLTTTPSPNSFTVTNTVTCAQTLTLVKKVTFGSLSADSWTLTSTGPDGSLAGPTGTTGAAGATNVPVTPQAAYSLMESSSAAGAENYVPTSAGWVCASPQGSVQISSAAVTVGYGQTVTCTITNTTSRITVLKHIVDPGSGLHANAFGLTVTPPTGLGSAISFPGSETADTANTIEVKPGAAYTLAEQSLSSSTAYLSLGLQRSTDGGATWTDVSGDQITETAGTNIVYRFVSQSVASIMLPLTGGLGLDVIAFWAVGIFLLVGGLIAWQVHRRRRAGYLA